MDVTNASPSQADWLPDWTDSTKYPEPEKTSWRGWAWEFLRRNAKYQMVWQQFAALPSGSIHHDFSAEDISERLEKDFGLLVPAPPSMKSSEPDFQNRPLFATHGRKWMKPVDWPDDVEPYVRIEPWTQAPDRLRGVIGVRRQKTSQDKARASRLVLVRGYPHKIRRLNVGLYGERSMLQDLIDEALYEAFGDYETWEGIDNRVVAILQDKRRAAIKLPYAKDMQPLEELLNDAVQTIEMVNGRSGFGLISLKRNGRGLILLLAVNDTEKGIRAVELKRGTTDPLRDLIPLPDMRNDPDCAPIEVLEWGGSRRRVDVAARDYVVIWISPGMPKESTELAERVARRKCEHPDWD
jgi:hypothetical protein